MAGAGAAALRTFVKQAIAGSLIGLTISDRLFQIVRIDGPSMHPTFEDRAGQYVLVKRSGFARYDFSRGDVVTFMLPADHRRSVVQRLIGLPGDWISVPETAEILKIPEGHCWVEGDNRSESWDSRHYGPSFPKPTGDTNHTIERVFLLVWCRGRSLMCSGRLTRWAKSRKGCQKEGSCRSDTSSLSSLAARPAVLFSHCSACNINGRMPSQLMNVEYASILTSRIQFRAV